MPIPLLGNDHPIDAATWNTLFSALDSKISAVMDRKNLAMLPGALLHLDGTTNIGGMVFQFVNGPRPYSSLLGGKNYSHQPFIDAARDLPVSLWNAESKIVRLVDLVPQSYRDSVDMGTSRRFFDRSLEAHRRNFTPPGGVEEAHWIIEPDTVPSYRPQKIYRYAQAEIVIEGIGLETVKIETIWNKFNFFRVHNCNPYSVTINFADVFSIAIPRWESRCVRRDSVSAGYLEGFNYFHKFKVGDPRQFQMPIGSDTPHLSMGTNNVISPKIAYDVIGLFLNPVGGPRLWVDPHELNDIATLYAQHFPAITDATPIGDLLHHRGTLRDVKTDSAGVVTETSIPFEGYALLKSRWPAEFGISVTENADGTISLQTTDTGNTHDLWSVGTNLLDQSGTKAPVANLNSSYTLDSHKPTVPGGHVRPVVTTQLTSNLEWEELSEILAGDEVQIIGEQDVTLTETQLVFTDAPQNSNPISLHRDTIAGIKTLDPWGSTLHPGQDTLQATFTARTVTLTPLGLTVTFSQEISLTRDGALAVANALWSDMTIDATTVGASSENARLDGTTLVYDRAIVFTGYGWPTIAGGNLGFIGPRKGRLIAALAAKIVDYAVAGVALVPHEIAGGTAIRHHPSINKQPFAEDGADFGLLPPPKSQRDAELTDGLSLSVLHSVYPQIFAEAAFTENPFDFPVFEQPDVLGDFLRNGLSLYSDNRDSYLNGHRNLTRFIRMNLLREHYNTLANYVNAIKKCRPFTFAFWTFAFEGSTENFLPNSVGPHGGIYRPANQYAAFGQNSEQFRMCQQLGIPILTKDDLPASYATVKATPNKLISITTKFQQTETYVSTGITEQTDFQSGFTTKYYTHTYRRSQALKETVIHRSAGIIPETGSLLNAAVFGGSDESEDFFWCSIEDVQAYAESQGFLFHMERAVVPFKLQIFELDTSFDRLFVTNETTDGPTYSEGPFITNAPRATNTKTYVQRPFFAEAPAAQANFALMVEALTLAEAEWVRDRDSVRLLDYRAGDSWVSYVPSVPGIVGVIQSNPSDTASMETSFMLFLRLLEDDYRFYRAQSDFSRFTKDPPHSDALALVPVHASLLLQSYASPALERNSKAVLIDVPWIEHDGADFSRTSRRNSIGRLAHGYSVLPLKEGDYLGPNAAATPLGASQTLLVGSVTEQQPIIFLDWPLTLS